jgi:hypothetical protein
MGNSRLRANKALHPTAAYIGDFHAWQWLMQYQNRAGGVGGG